MTCQCFDPTIQAANDTNYEIERTSSRAWYVLHWERCIEHLRRGGEARCSYTGREKTESQPKMGSHEFLRDLNDGRKACFTVCWDPH
jgi:hypothetical protein